MYTLTAIFGAPENKEAFDKHYVEIHTPIVKSFPGIRRIEVTRVAKMLTPPTDTLLKAPHLVCTMYFDDKASMLAALNSEQGMASGADARSFAGPLLSMITGEVTDIPL